MVATIHTPDYLETTEFVDNAGGLITAAFGRDLIESAFGVPMSTQTTAYTAVITDRGTTIRGNVTSPSTLNVTLPPNVFSGGHVLYLRQVGTGAVGFAAGAGVTMISSSGTFTTIAQGAVIIATLDPVTANQWWIDGDRA